MTAGGGWADPPVTSAGERILTAGKVKRLPSGASQQGWAVYWAGTGLTTTPRLTARSE
jgi:hypothetical protein